MGNKKTQLTLRDEVALKIWAATTAHYGFKDDEISPENLKITLRDSYDLADAALEVINEQGA